MGRGGGAATRLPRGARVEARGLSGPSTTGTVISRTRGGVIFRNDRGETSFAPRSVLQREGTRANIDASNRVLRRDMFARGATQREVIAATERNAQRIRNRR